MLARTMKLALASVASVCAAALLLISSLVQPAWATPFASSSVYVRDFNGTTSITEYLPGSINYNSPIWPDITHCPACAKAYARALPGNLGVFSEIGMEALTDGRVQFESSAGASYQDVLQFSGNGPINLRLRAEVFASGGSAAVSAIPLSTGASSRWTFRSTIQYYWGQNQRVFNICSSGDSELTGITTTYCDSSEPLSVSDLFGYTTDIVINPGELLYINASMSASTYALAYNFITGQKNGGVAVAQVDAMNSLRNGITVLTEGASFTAESGHDYVFVPHVHNVPEPGSLVLAALAILAGAGVRCTTDKPKARLVG